MEKTTFSIRLNNLRKEKSWTRKKLAEVCGLSGGTISNVLVGVSLPSGFTILAICEGLRVSSDYLLGLSDERVRV